MDVKAIWKNNVAFIPNSKRAILQKIGAKKKQKVEKTTKNR